MRGHKVGNNILVHPDFAVDFLEFSDERIIDSYRRFSHFAEDIVGDMLGSNAELSAYMIAAKLSQKGTVSVRHHVIEPDTGADEYLFYFREIPELSEQF